MSTVSKVGVSAAILVLAILAAFFLLERNGNDSTEENAGLAPSTATSLVIGTETEGTAAPGTSAASPEGAQTLLSSMPSLEYSFSGADEGGVVELLKNDPENRDLWLQLAIYAKSSGDFLRAEEILQYVTTVWPSDFVAYNNLGDLYQNYLKNYPKAERAHSKAAELNPSFIQSYVNLYELYRFSYLDKRAQAPEALKTGLSRNPDSIELMVRLARHYRDERDASFAASYYRQAVTASEKAGAMSFAENLKKEAADAGLKL